MKRSCFLFRPSSAGMDDAECLRAAWEAPVIVEALDAVSRCSERAKTRGLLCIFVDTS